MPIVSKKGNVYFEWKSELKVVAKSTPESVAPKVFAIVFKERIAALVLSISSKKVSKSLPLRFDIFLRASTSDCFVLKIIASSKEQNAETASVIKTVIIK